MVLFVFPYSSSSSSTTRFLCCRYQGLVEFVRIIWSDYTAYQQTRHRGCFETVFFLIGRCNFPTFRQRGLQWLESSLEYFLHGFVEHFEVFVLRFGANLLPLTINLGSTTDHEVYEVWPENHQNNHWANA